MSDTPEQAYRETFRIEQRIRNLTQWGQPEPGSVNATVLAALEAKRDRLAPIAARHTPDSTPRTFDVAPPIHFKTFEPVPIGTLVIDDVIGEMPAFLRRERT